MSSKGDEIGAEIAAKSAAVSPWPAVGDAVAARLGRTLYYFSAAAVVAFPQSLQGTPPTESVLTANPTAATPALIAQAAMPVGVPNLAIWPAHTMLLHLWTFAPLLPIGEKYSVLATLKQVDAVGATVATLKAYPINGDAEFPDDIWSPNWARTDLAVDMAQLQGATDLRLEIDLTLYTSCASALVVQLQIGGPFASYLDTSLTAAGGGVSSVESTDGSIAITDVAPGLQDLSVVARPSPSLTKRYYLTGQMSDRLVGGYNGFLLSTTNPSDEAHAVDLAPPGSGYYNWFDSPAGEPGLATWPSGSALLRARVRVLNTHAGLTYTLYPGDHSIVYESLLGREGYVYNVEPFASAPTIGASYQTVNIALALREMTGPSSDRLKADLILQATGGSITDEVLEIRCGGDNASYFDTLFTPSSGATVHNDLTGRGYDPDDVTDCHPMSAITPGRMHSPCGARVTTSSGLFTMPNSNTVRLGGLEPLLGIDREASGANPWQAGDVIYILNDEGTRIIQGSASVPGTHNAIFLGPQFQDPEHPELGLQLSFPFLSVLSLFYNGVDWLLAGQPTFG
jgi:hypothetical protein